MAAEPETLNPGLRGSMKQGAPLISLTSAGVLKPFKRALGPYSSAATAAMHSPALLRGTAAWWQQ